MKQLYINLILIGTAAMLFSCSAPNYFHDPSSRERQQELRNTRTGNVFADIFLGVSTVCLSAALETDFYFEPHEQSFKNVNLLNPTRDTAYVNMLTDVYWDENNYCDFMDIRIPPGKTCKIMVPLNASYHLYYSNTPESDDDEMMELFTNDVKNIHLFATETTFDEHEKYPD